MFERKFPSVLLTLLVCIFLTPPIFAQSSTGYKGEASSVSSDTSSGAVAVPAGYDENGVPLYNECATCPPQYPPEFYPFDDRDTFYICEGGTIYDTLTVIDPNSDQLITVTLHQGPGTVSSTPTTSPAIAYYTYTPLNEGGFNVTFKAKDSQGYTTYAIKTYFVFFNEGPAFTNGNETIPILQPGTEVSYDFEAVDPENDPITYRLISGEGAIDPETGLLTFIPDNSGTYQMLVEAADTCGTDTAYVIYEVSGTPPEIVCPDEWIDVFICEHDTLCFPITGIPENYTVVVEPASAWFNYETGQVCFFTDCSVQKDITVTITPPERATPPLPEETVCQFTVNVTMNSRPLVIMGPGTSMENCLPQEICVPAGISDIDNNIVSISVLPEGAVYNSITGQVCYTPPASGQYEIIVTAIDECGAIGIDTTVVTAVVNTAPVVISADDFSVEQCLPTEICFPVSINDTEGNIAEIIVSPAGSNNESEGTVCFTPEGPGVYEITTTATDECGLTASDVTVVTITTGQGAVIECPEPFEKVICEPTEICLDIPIGPEDAVATVSFGDYTEGRLCFPADTAGTYNILVTASNECGTAECLVTVHVIMEEAPHFTCPAEPQYFTICEPTQLCIEVPVTPVDARVSAWNGTYSEGIVCFNADTSGYYRVDVFAQTACGYDTCRIYSYVTREEAPVIDCPTEPILVNLCEPGEICYDLDILPAGAEVSVSQGTYADGRLCLTAEAEGLINVEVTATNECGTAQCTVTFDVRMGEKPVLDCPTEPVSFTLCGPGEVCTDIGVIPPEAQVTVSQGSFADGRLCFYAEEPGLYGIDVTASTECGATECTVVLDVMFKDAPEIVCPAEPVVFTICEPTQLCVDLPISPDDAKITVSGGSYVDGQLCLDVVDGGTYSILVMAINECGTAECTVTFVVNMDEAPAIDCPVQPVTFELCEPQEICLDLGVSPENAEITVSNGVYVNGQLCLNVSEAGEYVIDVSAANQCGTAHCTVTFNVTFKESPAITCPAEPPAFAICEPTELCIDLPVSPADAEVTVSAGTYSNGRLCLSVEDGGQYNIIVTAVNECGTAECTVVFSVTDEDPPVIACPTEPVAFQLCEPGEICYNLGILPEDADITVSQGTYSNGVLCLNVSESGTHIINVTAANDCGTVECAVTFEVVIDEAPVIACPVEPIHFDLCEPGQVCFNLAITPAEAQITLSQGTYSDGKLCLDVQSGGGYEIAVSATTVCGTANCMVTFVVDMGEAPMIACPTVPVPFDICGPTQLCIDLPVTPAEAQVTVSNGTYSEGRLCLDVETGGEYTIEITAATDCGTNSCTVVLAVAMGEAPVIDCPTEPLAFEVCEPTQLCIDLPITPVDAEITLSQGTYSDGKLCLFVEEAGIYQIDVTAVTSCGSTQCQVTFNVDFGQAPEIVCPNDTAIFICAPGNISIPVAGITPGAEVTVTPSSAWFDAETQTIGFYTNCTVSKNLGITVSTACGQVTCEFAVEVTLNTAPLVILAPDFDVTLCDVQEICIPAGVTDIDENIASITVTPSGTYNPISGRVCFTPDGPGLYTINLQALDDCGAVDTDEININVIINTPPVVQLPPDTEELLCESGEICFEMNLSDAENNIADISVSGGVYSAETGLICFTPEAPGVYEIIATVTDECGAVSEDAINYTVSFDQAPIIGCPTEPVAYFLCGPELICYDLNISPDDAEVTTSLGTYANGQLCFTPETEGTYQIEISAQNLCGTAQCTIVFNVDFGDQPDITCPLEPITVFLCEPGQVCRELNISPVGASVTVTGGTYSEGNICFNAETSGTYEIGVTAETACGIDNCTIVFEVTIGAEPLATCPEDETVFLCAPEAICRPLGIFPADAAVLISPLGTYGDGQFCFTPDTAGTYVFSVTATNQCGESSCGFAITVQYNSAPIVNAGVDVEFFQCEFEQICLPVTISDADDNMTQITVSHGGIFNAETNQICFTPTTVGQTCLTITATDECGATASDIVCVTITTGAVADIACPTGPFERMLCNPGQVCVPVAITPASAQITTSFGTYSNGQLCFQADTAGTYRIDISATAPCGSDQCQVVIHVTFGAVADITCPDLPITASLCAPGNVSVTLPITPSTAQVTVTPLGTYSFSTGKLTFYADTSGQYIINVMATAPCGSDQCQVRVNVAIESAPIISCPEDIDTLVCVSEIEEICFPVAISGTNVSVQVQPAGTYSGGMVCIPVSQAGTFEARIIAQNFCGSDECQVFINVEGNQPPILTVPDDLLIPSCTDDPETICIDGIYAGDPDGDPVTITKTCGPGTFIAVRPDSGEVCFTPVSNDATYEFCIQVDDGCQTVTKTFNVTIYPSNVCETCVNVAIVTDSCYVVGYTVPVHIRAEAIESIGGYDLLISYDASVMTFVSAFLGQAISGWEYFTYKIETSGCGGGCPSGLLRLVAIADKANGANHPPEEQLTPDGDIALINMRLTHDQNIGGQYLPMKFFWMDCGDNAFSDPTGNKLYIDAIVFDPFGSVIWDEADEGLFPESNRIDYVGAPDECLTGDKITPIRCVEFHNGGICVKHPSEIDDRGDLNLNGVSYEIGDAVVFTNFFIYGFAAFTVNVDGQTAASDVNADGMPLTVADLVYLIRVIVGDASANPKIAPDGARVRLAAEIDESELVVRTDANYDIGAALLVFDYEGVMPQIPVLGEVAEDMAMLYRIDGNEVRVLVYSFEKGVRIEQGLGNLLNIPLGGDGRIQIKEAVFVGYNGEQLPTQITSKLLPEDYVLSQNYPNPFNPTTSIDLVMPLACHWQLTIFNATGQLVKRFEGDTQPGRTTVVWDGTNTAGATVASGIYFYQLSAGDFAETKKMILLK